MASTSRFLRDYLRSSWRRRPAAFQQATETPFAEQDEIFGGLLELSARLARGEHNTRVRLYSSGRLSPEPSAFSARPDDKSLSRYLRRLQRSLGGDIGLIVNQFQAVQPALFARCADFLDDLYEQVGMPAGGASLELFAGNYRTGPFGVHKDEQEVITFVLEGRKRVLLWPFEELQAELGVSAGRRESAFVPLAPFDYRPHRSRAVVLEGAPGDVLCWPREWWHVAESDGRWTTTLALGLFLTGNPLQHAARVANDLWREGSGQRTRHARKPGHLTRVHLDAHLAAAERGLRSSRLRARLASRLLSFQTAAGFHEVPDSCPASDAPPSDETRLRLSRCNAMAWEHKAETLILGARGRLLHCPAHPRLLALFRRLVAGETLKVAEILEKHSGPSETAAAVFLMEREELRGILGRLLATGAVVEAGRARRSWR